MTFTGLQALSVEIPITVSTGNLFSLIALTIFSGPVILVCAASYGK